MSWFEEWFDSPLYEKLYANRNEDEAMRLADFIEKLIPKEYYPHILDLGCGRGRHSITLAERGYKVTGVDLSGEAIAKATGKAEERGLKNTQFLVGDMREPIGSNFNAILNLFTTFGYFLDDAENARVLHNMAAMLKKEGVVIIDFLNANQVIKNLVPQEGGSFRDLNYQIERKIDDGMVFKIITFSGPLLKGPVQYQERVKLYDLEWFKTHLSDAGLDLLHVYGNYQGESYDEENSPRLVMVGRNG